MTTIVSKRHFFKFYFSLILATLFYLSIGTVLLFIYINEIFSGSIALKTHAMPVFFIACYAIAGYSVYRYFKNAPNIILDKNNITFNKQTYSIADINEVTLTGKHPFKYGFNFPMEAVTITFNTNETKYIFDEMYSNTWEIKSFLKQVVIDNKYFFDPSEYTVDIHALTLEFFETYKGPVLTSLRGISLWGVIGFFAFILVYGAQPIPKGYFVGLFCISIIWFLLHVNLLNYFQVSDNYFVVRNHNFFWTKKAYYLKDIEEVVFETQGKMPNCLRIITKNYKNKLYPASTLRDKTWLELKDKLEKHKIYVRNECI
jgi:ABC-type multidrug transport system fused ATPase/permease subunit